jgi:hypothetical protein
MADKVESAILYNEPRISLERVKLDDSQELQGLVLIEVVYRVKSTQFPFQLRLPVLQTGGHRYQPLDHRQPPAGQRLNHGYLDRLPAEPGSPQADPRRDEPEPAAAGRAGSGLRAGGRADDSTRHGLRRQLCRLAEVF